MEKRDDFARGFQNLSDTTRIALRGIARFEASCIRNFGKWETDPDRPGFERQVLDLELFYPAIGQGRRGGR